MPDKDLPTIDGLEEHFRICASTIRRLLRKDPIFREICEDYEDATTAWDHWQAAPAGGQHRAEAYLCLVAELEAEIETILRHETQRDAARLKKMRRALG